MAEINGKGIWLKVLIGFLFTLILISFTLAGNALSLANGNSGEIKSIQTDISWVKASLDRIEGALGTKN